MYGECELMVKAIFQKYKIPTKINKYMNIGKKHFLLLNDMRVLKFVRDLMLLNFAIDLKHMIHSFKRIILVKSLLFSKVTNLIFYFFLSVSISFKLVIIYTLIFELLKV